MLQELVVDNFAGGGGASTGIEAALGRPVDIAINHDRTAILMHKANHPNTFHYREDVWEVDPVEACKGRSVGLAWFSPDCKHFSKAKGSKPRDNKIRGLAWVAVKWAKAVSPRIIMLENVTEFMEWGPLDADGNQIESEKGKTFRAFVCALRKLGYKVEVKLLSGCDYGAPTIRKRMFIIARRDGQPIVWPEPTHGDPKSKEVRKVLQQNVLTGLCRVHQFSNARDRLRKKLFDELHKEFKNTLLMPSSLSSFCAITAGNRFVVRG